MDRGRHAEEHDGGDDVRERGRVTGAGALGDSPSARLEDGIARLLTRDERIDGRDARRVGGGAVKDPACRLKQAVRRWSRRMRKSVVTVPQRVARAALQLDETGVDGSSFHAQTG